VDGQRGVAHSFFPGRFFHFFHGSQLDATAGEIASANLSGGRKRIHRVDDASSFSLSEYWWVPLVGRSLERTQPGLAVPQKLESRHLSKSPRDRIFLFEIVMSAKHLGPQIFALYSLLALAMLPM
jgi:hypothetical protein